MPYPKPDFTIRAVDEHNVVHVLTQDDIEASIRAAGYAPAVGVQQLQFVIKRALQHKLNPTPIVVVPLDPEPGPTGEPGPYVPPVTPETPGPEVA